ncbi:MAG: DUF2087 domain-containing protein [Pseudolysinimonas sp.]
MTDGNTDLPDARAVLALLGNDDARRMLSLISLGLTPDPAQLARREERVVQRLLDARVIVRVDGVLAVNTEGLKAAVARYSPPRPEGIDRFVRDGRIVNYPSSDADRLELLHWIGERVLAPGEIIDEHELNDRLHSYLDEHVLLRRYLVDYRVIDRNPDGTGYGLVRRAT